MKTCGNCKWLDSKIDIQCNAPLPLVMEWLAEDYGTLTVPNRDAEDCQCWEARE